MQLFPADYYNALRHASQRCYYFYIIIRYYKNNLITQHCLDGQVLFGYWLTQEEQYEKSCSTAHGSEG